MTRRKVQRIRRREWKVNIIIGGFGRQVAATRCGHSSQRHIVSHSVKNLVSATEACRRNKSHKIKSDWISATYGGDRILMLRQRFPKRLYCTHEVICRRDVPHNMLQELIARPVHMEWFVAAKLLQWHVAWCVPTLAKTRRGENRSLAKTKYLGV